MQFATKRRCRDHKPVELDQKVQSIKDISDKNKLSNSYFEPLMQVEARLVCPSMIAISSSNDHIQCQESVGLEDLRYTSWRLR